MRLVVVRRDAGWHARDGDAVGDRREARLGAYRDRLGPGWERMLGDLKGWLEEGRKLPGR